jgi:hypothetical protein
MINLSQLPIPEDFEASDFSGRFIFGFNDDYETEGTLSFFLGRETSDGALFDQHDDAVAKAIDQAWILSNLAATYPVDVEIYTSTAENMHEAVINGAGEHETGELLKKLKLDLEVLFLLMGAEERKFN